MGVVGGFDEIPVLVLFFFVLTKQGSECVEEMPHMFWAFSSINLFSQGFAAIQRSNQLHLALFLSKSLCFRDAVVWLGRPFTVDFDC